MSLVLDCAASNHILIATEETQIRFPGRVVVPKFDPGCQRIIYNNVSMNYEIPSLTKTYSKEKHLPQHLWFILLPSEPPSQSQRPYSKEKHPKVNGI
jgi:hypothetical protein